MGEKTLKFNNYNVNKNEFHKFKQAIELNLVDAGKKVVSDRFKHSEEGFQYFIGSQEDEVKPLCIILPLMNDYIKYFEKGGKNTSFLIKNEEVWQKHEDYWNMEKNMVCN